MDEEGRALRPGGPERDGARPGGAERPGGAKRPGGAHDGGRAGGVAAPVPVRGAPLSLAAGTAFAIAAALLPLARVIQASWLLPATGMVLGVLLVGFLLRSTRLPRTLALLGQLLLWMLLATAVMPGSSAIAGFLPTFDTIRSVQLVLQAAMWQIVESAAPVQPGHPLVFLIVAATGLLAIIVDYVVSTARLPLLASVALIAVFLMPAIAVPSELDMFAIVALAAAILFLIRAETRTRRYRPPRSPALSGVATAIGAVSIVVALALTPLLPTPVPPPGSGVGPGTTIDASLDLGRDLRRPVDVEVLQMSTDAPRPPYLRIATLSTFSGQSWRPDTGQTRPLQEGFDGLDVGVATTERNTRVEITGLQSNYLPLPYAAVAIDNTTGSWNGVPANRTAFGAESSNGQTYRVQSQEIKPTREQARAATASAEGISEQTLMLPEDLSESIDAIGDTAREITAGTTNDYDALVELQAWFRSGDFSYSLDAPVDEGFDGTGIDAIETFLDVREGYCVHFASAFAVMARTLDIPSRIVIGYLPGTSTGETVDGSPVYAVSSSQLHAWPEVHLDGLGWIPFEPTATLGTPTSFLPSSEGSDPAEVPEAEQSPPPGQSPAPSEGGRTDEPLDETNASGPGQDESAIPVPVILVLSAVILLAATPAVVRALRRRARVHRARGGDAAAAWRELIDTAIDAGITIDATDSPRAVGERLVTEHAVPADAMELLVTGIEHASFAPAGAATAPGGTDAAPGGTGAAPGGGGAISGRHGASPDRGGAASAPTDPASAPSRPAAADSAASTGSAYGDELVRALTSARAALLPRGRRAAAVLLPRSLVQRPLGPTD